MMPIYEILWLIIIPGVLVHWCAIIQNCRNVVGKGWKPDAVKEFKQKIIFLIATRDCQMLVQDTINSVHAACKVAGLNNYEVKVVTDADCKMQDAEVLTIPENYVCKSKFKARGLNYALSHLPNSKEAWIFHLDEDSRIVPQTVHSIVDYINKGGKPISNGLTVFITNGNPLTFFGEAHRMWTFLWLKQQLKTRPMWMNGSNMLCRSDVEQEIGWNFGNMFSEDTSFAYTAARQKGNIFGWHGGITIEHPASSIFQLWRQRKRWFYGGLIYWKHCPTNLKPFRIYSSTCWMGGFFLTAMYFMGMFGYYSVLPVFVATFGVTALLWYARYQVGMYYMLKYNGLNLSTTKKAAYHIGMLVLTPVVELLCTFPTILAVINPPKGFEVTGK